MALDKKNGISNLFCKVFIANFDRRKHYVYQDFLNYARELGHPAISWK